MTRDEARELLLAGEILIGGAWTWSLTSMSCGDWNCCSDEFTSVEEALDNIDMMVGFDDVSV
jgi:hypothetical protein